MVYFENFTVDKMKKKKNKYLAIFYSALAIYVVLSVVFFVWYLQLPYASPTINLVKTLHHVLTGVFTAGAFFYLMLPYKRVKNYYKVSVNLAKGIKETTTASFLRYDENLHEKDGVDFKALVFSEYNKYKKDFYERKVLVFYDKEFPKFEKGQNVTFITQGNVLISYEIL